MTAPYFPGDWAIDRLPTRIAAKIKINPVTGCWEWQAARAAGYGRVYWGGRVTGAHRTVFTILREPIPADLTLDHLRRVRHCVNPSHLEPVTRGENVLRSPIAPPALNARKTHCPAGHEYTPETTYYSKEGYRSCRACHRDEQRAYRQDPEVRRARAAEARQYRARKRQADPVERAEALPVLDGMDTLFDLDEL